MAGLHAAHRNYRANGPGGMREASLLWGRIEVDKLDARLHGFFPARVLNVQAVRSGRFRRWLPNV